MRFHAVLPIKDMYSQLLEREEYARQFAGSLVDSP